MISILVVEVYNLNGDEDENDLNLKEKMYKIFWV